MKRIVLNGAKAGSWRDLWSDGPQAAVVGKRQERAKFKVRCRVTGSSRKVALLQGSDHTAGKYKGESTV